MLSPAIGLSSLLQIFIFWTCALRCTASGPVHSSLPPARDTLMLQHSRLLLPRAAHATPPLHMHVREVSPALSIALASTDLSFMPLASCPFLYRREGPRRIFADSSCLSNVVIHLFLYPIRRVRSRPMRCNPDDPRRPQRLLHQPHTKLPRSDRIALRPYAAMHVRCKYERALSDLSR